ncbi:single-stranded DNA-binding protein [Candidatus Peregrinibacteria bacterium]|nr:single-stranded DNA-binding protein [Candidatus Peregrinibacteria bacterium]
MNKVIIVGNVTRDPEMRQTSSGQTIATFGVATNREWAGSDGQKKSLAEYHNVVAWGRLAELCIQYLKKGKLVYLEGYLKTRSWDHESGVKVFRTEIVISDMIMLEKRVQNDTPPEVVHEEASPSVSTLTPTPTDYDDDFFADAPSSETTTEK